MGTVLQGSQRNSVSSSLVTAWPLVYLGHLGSSIVLFLAVIRFIVDSADKDTFPAAKSELHALLEKPQLMGIPVLVRGALFALCHVSCSYFGQFPVQVLGNKNDLDNHAKVEEIISALSLSTITNREVSCYSISGEVKGWC